MSKYINSIDLIDDDEVKFLMLKISKLDTEHISPIQAIVILDDIKKRLKSIF